MTLDQQMDLIEAQCKGLPTNYWEHVVGRTLSDGLWLEFGVCMGHSLRLLAGWTEGPVYGFDSFEGIPEPWDGHPKGWLSLAELELPKFTETNIHIIKGRFEETLEKFLSEHDGEVSLAHIDCDVYSSTDFVLRILEPRITPGTIICFDELLGFPDSRNHELKAWAEFLLRTGLETIPLARKTDEWRRVSVVFEVRPASSPEDPTWPD